MLVERATHPQFLSNTYLVADSKGGPAFFVDAGGPVDGLIQAAERLQLVPTHVLLTHHHYDHISDVGALCARWPNLQVLISERERELMRHPAGGQGTGEGPETGTVEARTGTGEGPATGTVEGPVTGMVEARMGTGEGPATGTVEAGQTLRFGALEVRALPTPGHTAGMLSFFVTNAEAPGASSAVFTGDTLFRGSVGGVRAPGHTTYADLRSSIMDTLMQLPRQTVVHPGHAQDTTVAHEWEHNPFIRVWRSIDPEGQQQCIALDQPATLVLSAPDYDGGTKAWVRWPNGADDIVPGSRVELAL
jgi:hydroxyacylglutathione hydrolase